MQSDKEKIIRWIEENREQIIEFLQQLVQIPSDNPAGDCLPIASRLHGQLSQMGFEKVSLLEVDPSEVKAAGMLSLANVVAAVAFGDGDGPRIALNAHGDVVPPGLGWSVDPYGGEIRNGKMYGRGVAVSKSDIAAYTYAVQALRQAGVGGKLQGEVDLAFTFDEETGGELGPKWLLERGHIRPDMALVAGFTHAIVNAHNGCLHFEITAIGKSAHAAIPETGIDAVEAMVSILQSLYAYREVLKGKHSTVDGIDHPTLVVGLISGGINTNVVPDVCRCRVDRRLIPEEDPIEAEEEFRRIVESAAAKIDGLEVEIHRVLHAQSFGPVPNDTPIIQALAANWRSLMKDAGELSIHGVPLYTDARHFAAQGIATAMFGAGPRTLEEANGHRADEHVQLEDLIRAVKIVACTLYDLLLNESEG
ncbi:ArgE/DapE family deacylase [Paenibacillus cremeus]|uniref:Probable succinyl-diaminopimelate desuccinylase n=1 Tax=Paenibacillus cremeus TaxID=2163881 RepID=A0A559KGL1_9BACL|nr:ArgE/DapE family deacylase [Paenibacillus cremeus]TVY11262.1 ArgE/DapE family deacylase [Paenibacillus cremeus]